MTEVVSVRFKSKGKVYFFDPAGNEVSSGDSVVVETAKGLELGICAKGNHSVPDEKIVPPLRPVIRRATEEDIKASEGNKAKEAEAFKICQRKIADHELEMKLVDVVYSFEGNKIVFFFTSDGRVDFRELVKDLASVFRTRIELRQIGVRDEAKMIGGLGICGRAFCCSAMLDDFQPVSTKMAKTQSISLNPTKISGNCGRLMCCLRYEQEAYEDLLGKVPKNGTMVYTPNGAGYVASVNLLRQKVKVRIDNDGAGEQVFKTYDSNEISLVPGAPEVLLPASDDNQDGYVEGDLSLLLDDDDPTLDDGILLKEDPGKTSPEQTKRQSNRKPRQQKKSAGEDRASAANKAREPGLGGDTVQANKPPQVAENDKKKVFRGRNGQKNSAPQKKATENSDQAAQKKPGFRFRGKNRKTSAPEDRENGNPNRRGNQDVGSSNTPS